MVFASYMVHFTRKQGADALMACEIASAASLGTRSSGVPMA